MSDFRVKITVRSERILAAIEERFGSQSEMARQTGIHTTRISAFVTMRQSPVSDIDGWLESAIDFATALGKHPDELWPEHMRQIQMRRASREIPLPMAEAMALTDSGEETNNRLMLERLKEVLTERERHIVEGLAEGATFDEMSDGVTRERVRQIALRAYRKMRGLARREHIAPDMG